MRAAALAAALMAAKGGKVARIPDEAFWSGLSDETLHEAPPGISLLAPARADLGVRTTLPIAVRRRATMQQAARVPLERFGVIVAIDPERNQLWAGRAGQTDDDAPRFRPPSEAQLAGMGEGMTTQVVRLDVRDRLRVPWRPARLTLVALLQDQRSEIHTLSLAGTGGVASPDVASPDEPEPGAAARSTEVAAPARPGLVLQAKGEMIQGAVRSGHGGSAIALHLICLSGQDGFPVHLRFRVPLEAGTGGFALAPAQLATIAPGRPVWIWAFASDLTFGPLRYTRPR